MKYEESVAKDGYASYQTFAEVAAALHTFVRGFQKPFPCSTENAGLVGFVW
jgi:hypothetical protein